MEGLPCDCRPLAFQRMRRRARPDGRSHDPCAGRQAAAAASVQRILCCTISIGIPATSCRGGEAAAGASRPGKGQGGQVHYQLQAGRRRCQGPSYGNIYQRSPPPGAVSNRGVVCDVPAGGDRGGDSASQDQDGTVGRRRACALAPLGGAFPQPRSSHPTSTTTAPLAFDAPCASSSVTSPRQQRTIEKVVVMGFNVKPTPAATALKGSGSCDGVLQSH